MRVVGGVVFLLALMAVLAGGAARRESATIDEVAHIGAGLSYWQQLDMRFNEEHPPLAKLLAGLPLALRGTRADYAGPAWTESRSFLAGFLGEWVFGDGVVTQWNDATGVLLWARLPMLALTLALGLVLFVYARRLGGTAGGFLCLAVYVSAPVFLAFGPLVLTDTAITVFSLVALWHFAEMWNDPSPRNVRCLGLALGAAVLAKFSAAILILAMIVFAVLTRWWPTAGQPVERAEAKAWRRQHRRALRRSLFVAALVVYVVYLVFSWNQPIDIPSYTEHGRLVSWIGRFLMPPWNFLRGLAVFLFTSARPTILLGQWHPHAVWFYFPVVFALKSAPGFLGLLVLAAVLALARGRAPSESVVPLPLRTHWRLLWVALAVFVLVCMASPMNISIRHFSIPIVLLMLLTSPLPRLVDHLPSAPKRAVAVLAVALALGSLVTAGRAYPYYLPYVNVLGGGRPVYELLNDSNVDWNQALPEVGRFVQTHGIQDLALDEYGLSHTTPWVPHARYWNCQMPTEREAGQWVALSANMLLDSHNCRWLLQYPHETLGGGSMYAVRLPDPIPAAGTLGGPPLAADHYQFPTQRGGRDMRPVLLEAVWHPEKLPEILTRMAAEFQKAAAEKK
jgi:4-amino-4-deoxy-L-arabinose transferase-like glycosyltransferase